jgi:hypothetical protein
MAEFIHQRHKPPSPLEQPRELVIACAPLRSNVNLSRIVRAAGCCGVRRLIACGTAKVIERIARDSIDRKNVDRDGVDCDSVDCENVQADSDECQPAARTDASTADQGGPGPSGRRSKSSHVPGLA